MSCLAPCPACDRHVATDETTCPFCSTALPDSFRQAVSCAKPRERLSRAAMMVAGAALIGAEACSGSVVAAYGTVPPPPDAGADSVTMDSSAVPIYGAAPAPLEQAPAEKDATNSPARPGKP